MQKEGYVVFADETKAKIRIKRESSCGGNCSHCNGCGINEMLIEVDNTEGFKACDTVRVIMKDSSLVKKSLIGYGFLIFLIIFGAVLGYMVFENEFIALIIMLGFLSVGMFLLRLFFRNKKASIIVKKLD